MMVVFGLILTRSWVVSWLIIGWCHVVNLSRFDVAFRWLVIYLLQWKYNLISVYTLRAEVHLGRVF